MPLTHQFTLEQRFAPPPEYVMAWMLDVRPEDIQRWSPETAEGTLNVQRSAAGVEARISGEPMVEGGKLSFRQTGLDKWVVEGSGPLGVMRVDHRVAVVSGGTLLTVEAWADPSRVASFLAPLIRSSWRLRMRGRLGRMAKAMEEDWRAGKAPDA